MCDALTMGIGSLVIGAAQSVASGIQASQQAQAQKEYVEAQSAEYARAATLNNQAAVTEYTEQSAAERISQMQEKEAAAESAQAVQREALQKKGTMLASTNASGMALDYLLADYEREEANRRDDIRHQYEMRSVNSELNLGTFRERAQNRINSQQRYVAPGSTYSSGMNILGTALGIGGAAVNAWNVYDKYKQQEWKGGAQQQAFSFISAGASHARGR